MTIFTKKEVEKQDMYADSNEGMVVKLIILVGQVGEKEPLESSPRLELIFFRNFRFKFDTDWCISWSLVHKEVLSPLHRYVVVLALDTHIQLCLSTTQAIVLKLGIHNPHHIKVPSVC